MKDVIFVFEELAIMQYRKNRQNMLIFAKQFNVQMNIEQNGLMRMQAECRKKKYETNHSLSFKGAKKRKFCFFQRCFKILRK